MMYRIVYIVFVIIILIGSGCSSNMGKVTVVNATTEEIAKGKIEVCGQEIVFNELMPDEKYHSSFRIKKNDHYRVTINFASGREMLKEGGYVTRGFDLTEAVITVQEVSIEIRTSEIE